MKILHCCLAAFYIDNFGYQENILPKIHKLQGHDVKIVASTETYIGNKLGYIDPNSYLNEYKIPVTRIPYISYLPHLLAKKLRIYKGLNKIINDFQPNIIFLHDIQFFSIVDIVSFAKNNPSAKIYADGHTDFINSAKNWISKNILHRIIYRSCAKYAEPYISKFWGVTPLRVEFFTEVYKINKNKVDLLVLGVDDTEIGFSKKEDIRASIRARLNLENKFVIITGGKIDKRKKIDVLLEVINELNHLEVTLILFGSIDDDLKIKVESLIKSNNIINLGWISPSQANEYFFAADLAFFPGTHSVLWEQAVGCGLPAVFKRWDGIEHVDVGGNCLFIEEGDKSSIKSALLNIINNKDLYSRLKKVSEEKGVLEFSYSEIAKRAIELK